jgi:hypothetical protein
MCLVCRLINNAVPTAEIIWGEVRLEPDYVIWRKDWERGGCGLAKLLGWSEVHEKPQTSVSCGDTNRLSQTYKWDARPPELTWFIRSLLTSG